MYYHSFINASDPYTLIEQSPYLARYLVYTKYFTF